MLPWQLEFVLLRVSHPKTNNCDFVEYELEER